MEQIGSENVSDYLYSIEVGNSDVRYWDEFILSAVCFFWLIKVKSNESNVEQVQRGYSNYWANGGSAYGEK